MERPDLAGLGPVLQGFNPWWHGETVAVPEFRRPQASAGRFGVYRVSCGIR